MKIEMFNPDFLATDGQFVYTRLDSSEVVRLDPATGDILATTVVGGFPCDGLGASFGSVWTCLAQDDDPDKIVRIDAATDTVVATIDADKDRVQGTLAGGFDRVWVLVAGGTLLTSIDPTTNTLDEPIELGATGYELSVGADAVWVISNRDDTVLRIDPTTRTVTDRVEGVDEPVAIDAHDDVWVATVGGTVHIDPTSLDVRTFPIPVGYGGAIMADGSDVWIRTVDRFLLRVDAVTGQIVEEWDAGVGSGGDLTIAFGAVWATAYDDHLLVRMPR